MKPISFFQRISIDLQYCLPALLAVFILMHNYHGRLQEISKTLVPQCIQSNEQCFMNEVVQCDMGKQDKYAQVLPADNSPQPRTLAQQICQFRQQAIADLPAPPSANAPEATHAPAFFLESSSIPERFAQLNQKAHQALQGIFIYNAFSVFILVLLPYVLMGDLLAHSDRIHLDYRQRVIRANANWWMKFLVALIMSIGILYTLNPYGRGGSAYFQFFIETGVTSDKTLPIYILSDKLVPVVAGFLGWYLHFIGYTFTKLIHHDVISARVYGLLFKKFIVTYGIALTLPSSGLLGQGESATFMMFLIGLFPLSAMSLLIDAVGKFTNKGETSNGSLSQLPGISRWQILRLEEEGIDSMACLANTKSATIHINLQVIAHLTEYWADIARLYTILGHESYQKIKNHCLTASEFLHKAADPSFQETLKNIEGLCEAGEIARLLINTFPDTVPMPKV